MFKKQAVFIIDKEATAEEELMLLVLDAGADDLRSEEEQYEIIAPPEAFENIQQVLETNNIPVLMSQIGMIPDTTIALAGDEAIKLTRLVDALEDCDDVQEVYTNSELPESETD